VFLSAHVLIFLAGFDPRGVRSSACRTEEILPLVSRSRLRVGVSSNVKLIRMPTQGRGHGTLPRDLRVSFGVESPDRIEEGMRRLAAAVRAVL
jgi:hypothetical protein